MKDRIARNAHETLRITDDLGHGSEDELVRNGPGGEGQLLWKDWGNLANI